MAGGANSEGLPNHCRDHHPDGDPIVIDIAVAHEGFRPSNGILDGEPPGKQKLSDYFA